MSQTTISSPMAPPPQVFTNSQTLIDGQCDVAGVMVFLNGLLLTEGLDYTRAGGQVEMVIPPSPGDVLTARVFAIGRQLGGSSPSRYIAPWSLPLAGAYDGVSTAFQIVFGPTISGDCNGLNAVFGTAVSLARMQVFRNGILQTAGTDYGAFATVLVFKPGALPQPGDILALLGYG